DDVHPLLLQPLRLLEHLVSFAHARGEAEVDLQPAALLAADQGQELLWRWASAVGGGAHVGPRWPGRLRLSGPYARSAASSQADGSVRRKVVPWPGALSQVICPPWAVTISRTMARPSPVP